MKKNKKLLLTSMLVTLVLSTSALVVSCTNGGKDTVKYSFNTNGGTEIAAVEIDPGSEYTLPIPERSGYAFEGWYTTEDFSGSPVEKVTAAENVTYYAKWSQLCAINLNLDGGSLSENTTTLYLKAGENVYDFMQKYTPTKNGLQFGAWFNGDAELSKNLKITETGLTLVAKYKVAYTVELWGEKLEGEGYEKVAENITGYEYVGKVYTSKQNLTGFEEVEDYEGAVTSLTLSEDATKNVFKHYYKRKNFNVSFNSNYPDGSENKNESFTVKYGEEVDVPSDYEAEGYCLIGWATSASGDVVYKANYIDSVLYNKDENDSDDTSAIDKFKPERNTTLYAVWLKGYVDMFGNEDYIYLLDENSDVIYLSRGGIFFKGEYDPEYKEFLFINEGNDLVLEGKVYSNGTYIYYDSDRNDYNATLYQIGKGFIEETHIYFDAYNGLKYRTEDENGKALTYNATYVINKEGYYEVTFTDGDKAGETMLIQLMMASLNNVDTPAFMIRNEEEYNMKALKRYGFTANHELGTFGDVYTLKFSGFGVATYNTGSSETNYYYVKKDDVTYELTDTKGNSIGVIRIIENGNGYMFYNEALENTFTLESGATLTTDGVYSATYVNGNTTKKGYFTSKTSIFGGYIVSFIDSEKTSVTNTFLVLEHSEEVPVEGTDDQGNATETTETKITYTIEEKANGYAEYYYKDSDGIYYAPLIVINEPEAGKAILYGYTSNKEYKKYAYGEYQYDESSKLYSFTVAGRYEDVAGVLTTPVNMTTLEAIVFAVDAETTSYSVNYWHSATYNGKETENYEEVYTGANQGKLTLVGGFAIYSAEGKLTVGTYSVENNVMTIEALREKVYVLINESEKTFATLQYAPYNAYSFDSDNTIDKNVYIAFDGTENGAIYTIVTKDDNGEDVITEFKGTYKKLDNQTSEFDDAAQIYQFTAEGKEFQFIFLQASNMHLFAPYSEEYNGVYDATNGGRLELDGFSWKAKFTATNGTVYEGRYKFSSEGVVCLTVEGEEDDRYFDIVEDGKCYAFGFEYGTYMLVENQYNDGTYVDLDGYGNITVYSLEDKGEDEPVRTELGKGTYTISGKELTLTYEVGSEEITLLGGLNTFAVDSETTRESFVISNKLVVTTYVNEKDWSILVLDNIGNAVKYTTKGDKVEGSYTLITDTLLYYTNDDDDSEDCIYEYDRTARTATPITFSARGYYTTELDSLLFSKSGFAIFNGTTRYYYNVVEGEVFIYRQDPTNEEATEYGFVKESFGKFEKQREYNGKTYYANNGFDITFNRLEETKNNYPVLVNKEKCPLQELLFTPSGELEFSVSGTVKINDKNYSCTVVRELNDEEEIEMYVALSASYGYYRFDIGVVYGGENDDGSSKSTYEITSMKYVISAYSYTYLETYLKNYFALGAAYASTSTEVVGVVAINRTYDVNGDEIKDECYFTGEFGTASGMYDTNREIISFKKAEIDDSSSIYVATIQGADGYTYRMYFDLAYHKSFGLYGYRLYAFTREEARETNGCKVMIERVIATESSNYKIGDIYKINIEKDGVTYGHNVLMYRGGKVYSIVRTKDEDGKITATTYYELTLVEEDDSSLDEEVVYVPLYTENGITLESIEEVTTLYTEDGYSYVDISDTNGVLLVSDNGTLYVVTESTYDEATNTYTIVTNKETKFTVKVTEKDGSKIVEINEVEESESSEEA